MDRRCAGPSGGLEDSACGERAPAISIPQSCAGSTASCTTRLLDVLVVHENRALNPHTEDIARRLALDNFVAFPPDALFPLGGYSGDEGKARELFARLDPAKARAEFLAAANCLKDLPARPARRPRAPLGNRRPSGRRRVR
jgi:hypothetical protein